MNNLPQYFVVYCEQREGYLMDNGFFSHNVEEAKIFHKAANAKRSAWHYGATVIELKYKHPEKHL